MKLKTETAASAANFQKFSYLNNTKHGRSLSDIFGRTFPHG